jgi:predicted TIM-barrel fold metal-dependent hydrolase
VVFDHFGHTLLRGRQDPAFRVILQRLHTGQGWLKLSGVYIDSKVGPPDYPESMAVAKAYVSEAPEQLLWGTDWPHPTTQDKPDDAVLFDLFAQWVPDKTTQHRILVDNPAKLYGFH